MQSITQFHPSYTVAERMRNSLMSWRGSTHEIEGSPIGAHEIEGSPIRALIKGIAAESALHLVVLVAGIAALAEYLFTRIIESESVQWDLQRNLSVIGRCWSRDFPNNREWIQEAFSRILS